MKNKKMLLTMAIVATSLCALSSCGKSSGKKSSTESSKTVESSNVIESSNTSVESSLAESSDVFVPSTIESSVEASSEAESSKEESSAVEFSQIESSEEESSALASSEEDVLTHVEAKAATCEENGNIEYWYNSKTDEYFSDEAGLNKIEASDVIIVAHHNFVESDKTSSTSKFTCAECDKVILKLHDLYFSVDYVPATETEVGIITYKVYTYDSTKNEFEETKFVVGSNETDSIGYTTPVLVDGDKYTIDFDNDTVLYSKTEIIRQIRDIYPSLGLKDAKDFVEKYLIEVFTTDIDDAVALHEASEYTISYYRYNTITKTNDTIKTVKANGKDGFTVEDLSREYYELLGYDNASPGSRVVYSLNEKIIPTHSMNLYVYEKHVDVDVQFIPHGLNSKYTLTATEGKLTMPNFTEEYYYDYHVDYWYDENDKTKHYEVGKEYVFDEYVSLKPHITINTYSIYVETVDSTVEHDGYTVYECDQVEGRTKNFINNSDLKSQIGYGYVRECQLVPGRGVAVIMSLSNGVLNIGEAVELFMSDGTVKKSVITNITPVNTTTSLECATPSTGLVSIILRGFTEDDMDLISTGDLLCKEGKAIADVEELYLKISINRDITISEGDNVSIMYNGLQYTATTVIDLRKIDGYDVTQIETLVPTDCYIKLVPTYDKVFLSWVGQEATLKVGSTVFANGTVVAKTASEFSDYTSNYCDIRIYKNDGTDAFKLVSVSRQDSVCDIIPPYERENYTFLGYYIDKEVDDLEEMELIGVELAYVINKSNMNLYMIWQAAVATQPVRERVLSRWSIGHKLE